MPVEFLRFGDFELDRNAYELRRKGRQVKLERIPRDLLFLLTEQPGRLIGREEIFQRIWGKEVFLDTDNAINTAIRKIRSALKDDPDEPRFIVTVTAKGYRFVAPLQDASPQTSQAKHSQSAFVGRERETGELRAAMEDATSARARIVMISGAPGVGKTRLAEELAALAAPRRMEAMAGHCIEQDECVPYLPFVEILESWIDRSASVGKLRTLLGEQGPELARLLPRLRRMIPDLAPPLELQGEEARRHLFNSLCEFLARLSKAAPLLLIAEDLHWADESTLAMFIHLASHIANLRLMIVATYRDIESGVTREFAKMLENLLRARLVTDLRLKGLPQADVGKMIAGLSGQEPPERVVSEIYRETEGNPFFVEELFRYLGEENRLYQTDGRFRDDLDIGELEVPHGVRLVIGRRLQHLADQTQKMLATAAVIGRTFDFEVLTAASDAERDSILESIEAARRAGLILSAADSLRFEFSHELVRQTLLSTMSPPRRQQIHRAVAGAIEKVYRERIEEHLGELAHHYGAAADAPKAVHYLIRAGEQAAQRYADREAVAFLNRALELQQELPHNEPRAREELKVQKLLGKSWEILVSDSAPEVRAAAQRRLALSERLGDSRELFESLLSMVNSSMNREVRKARELADRELALAEQIGNPMMLAHAHSSIAQVLLNQGEFAAARQHFETGFMTADAAIRAGTRGIWDSWAPGCGQAALAWTLWFLGYPDQAQVCLTRALAATTNQSDPFWRASGWFHVLRAYVCLRHPQTLDIANSLASYLKEQGTRFLGGIAPLFVLWAQAEQGQANEAVSGINVGKARSFRGATPLSWVSLIMADMYAKAGCAADGLAMAAQGLRFGDETGAVSHSAELHRLNGELKLIENPANIAEAERCFRTAIEIARRQRAKSWELRATMSLARLLAKQRHRDEARAMLAHTYGWFTEGFDTPDLKDAKMLLDDLN